MEYLLLLVVVAVIFWKVIGHVQDVFYGWGGNPGAIELFVQKQVVGKLETNPGGW